MSCQSDLTTRCGKGNDNDFLGREKDSRTIKILAFQRDKVCVSRKNQIATDS